MQSKVRLTAQEIDEVKKLMESTRKADTAFEERRAVAYAVGWLETVVGWRLDVQ